nr:MAG TPA: hypothetical protein [Caudoviricetes sp.]
MGRSCIGLSFYFISSVDCTSTAKIVVDYHRVGYYRYSTTFIFYSTT